MKKAVKRFYSPMSKRAEKAMRENRNFGTPVVDYLKICCKDKEKDYPSLSPLTGTIWGRGSLTPGDSL